MWWREKKWANVLNYYYLLGAFLSPLYVVIAFGCSSCCQHDEWEFSNPESKPGKHSHVRGRKRGSHFQNLLLLQGPKKTEFRGNSSSWGCCIRVIEKSHIFCRVLFKMIEKSHIFQNIFDWNKYVSVWSCIFPCFEMNNVHRMLSAAFIWRSVHYSIVSSFSFVAQRRFHEKILEFQIWRKTSFRKGTILRDWNRRHISKIGATIGCKKGINLKWTYLISITLLDDHPRDTTTKPHF